MAPRLYMVTSTARVIGFMPAERDCQFGLMVCAAQSAWTLQEHTTTPLIMPEMSLERLLDRQKP